jgi:hypothetical protein
MNTVDRTYRVRGRDVHLQELADLAAVHGTPATVRTIPMAALISMAPESVLPQVRAFEDAGWQFVPRHQSIEGARVYVKSGGRVALGTDRLTVHIVRNRSLEEAESLLSHKGFRIVDRLKFAPNLFVVQAPKGDDAIDAAKTLSADNAVEFAEPELIEIISGRR